jgi:hypothetical protein
MGGLVARAAHLLPNYRPQSISNIITSKIKSYPILACVSIMMMSLVCLIVNAPHRSHPYLPDPSVSSFYASLNNYWSDPVNRMNGSGMLADVAVVSIVGGHRDTLIRSDLGSLHGYARC